MPIEYDPGQLASLRKRAEARPMRWQRGSAPGNLRIEVWASHSHYQLRIWRGDLYPTLQDWADILRAWPEAERVLPRQLEQGGRRYLQAVWPRPGQRTPRLNVPGR